MIERLLKLLTPARVAGAKRFGRYLAYQMAGFAIVNAGALVANLLLRVHASPELITAGSMLATAMAAGARRSYVMSQVVDPESIPTLPNPEVSK